MALDFAPNGLSFVVALADGNGVLLVDGVFMVLKAEVCWPNVELPKTLCCGCCCVVEPNAEGVWNDEFPKADVVVFC